MYTQLNNLNKYCNDFNSCVNFEHTLDIVLYYDTDVTIFIYF